MAEEKNPEADKKVPKKQPLRGKPGVQPEEQKPLQKQR